MKKFLSLLLTMTILCCLSNVVGAVEYGEELKNQPTKTYQQTFSDVSTTHWAFTYIAEMVEKGVISGYPDKMFRPENQVRRAEFAKIMVGAAGIKANAATASSFYDVTINDWYCPYIEAAKSYLTGYVMDGRNMYLPETAALREDIAVALVRLKGYDTSVADLGMLKAMFSDYDGISEMAKPYVAVAVERGLVSGYDDGTFRAQKSITRAEATTLLWRASQYGNDNKTTPDVTPESTLEPTTTPQPSTNPQPSETPEPSPDVIEEPEEPIKTPEPTPTPTPEPIPEKLYTIDSIVENIDRFSSMVVDNQGVVHYTEDQEYTYHGNSYIKNSNGEVFDCDKDFYPTEEESFDTWVLNVRLAYDSQKDILYAIGLNNGKSGGGVLDKLIIFDITDYSNPKIVLSEETFPYMDDFKFTGSSEPIIVFPNGSLLYENIYLINLEKNSISQLSYKQGGQYCINNKLYRIDGRNLICSDISGENEKSVNIQGTLINERYLGYDTNGFYFWDAQEGLCSLDFDGKRTVLATPGQIDSLDYKPLPSTVDYIVYHDETFYLYSLGAGDIRIMKKI